MASDNAALQAAARRGDRAAMRRAVAAGADINAQDLYGRTAAIWAAAKGHSGCLQYAVEAGASIHATNNRGWAAAMLAAAKGHRDCLVYAVQAGADIRAKNSWGRAAAMTAAVNGHRDCLEFAVEAGADIDDADSYGWTAAMLAAAKGRRACLEYAVEKGAALSATNTWGWTAAMLAAANGYRDCLEYAVGAGADLHAKNNEGWAAAMLAAANGHRDCLEFAVAAGADINAKNNHGSTAAMLAAQKGHRDCLEFAVEAGADIHAKNDDGEAVLHMARRLYLEGPAWLRDADTPAGCPKPPAFLRDVLSAIETYTVERDAGDTGVTRDLEIKLSLAAATLRQLEVQSAVTRCERAMSEGRRRVEDAVAAWREGLRDDVAEQCRARDADVTSRLRECEEVMAWARSREEDAVVKTGMERGRVVMERARSWLETKGDVEQLMPRVDDAVAGLEGPEDKLVAAENLLRKLKLRYKRRKVCEADVAKAERRLATVREEASRASAVLREAREALAAHEAAYPEVATKLEEREVAEGLQLLQASGMLQHRDLETEYEVLDTLTSGASHVLQAKLRSDGSMKALKKVKLEEVKQVQREVLTPSRLQHPNVMPVELAFIHGDFVYVQSSWCKHGDVGQWLHAARRSVRLVAAVAAGVLRGLRYLHDHGIVHGDVKPGNILIDDDLRPRISDWGSSRQSYGMTTTGAAASTSLGFTVEYAAPELLSEPRGKSSFASDMWAAGRVVQALLERSSGAMDEVEEGMVTELRGITKACCVEEVELRPSAASVLATSEYLLPSLRSALKACASRRDAAEALGRHVVWQWREGGVWKELSLEDSGRVERGYVTYVSAGAAMCDGPGEKKGDGDGGEEAADNSWSLRLGDGSIVSFRSMRMVARGGAKRWRVRREVKAEYSFPEHWPGHIANCRIVSVAADSEEYAAVYDALLRDVRGARVERIERVQNRYLWQRYEHQKHLLRGEVGEAGVNEVKAWHGTTATSPLRLCTGLDGVDFRMGRETGFFGRGAYFADNAAYSDADYASILSGEQGGAQLKQLIYAKVLCGNALEKGQSIDRDMVKPPSGHHSVVAGPFFSRNGRHPTKMCVVYDLASVYPGYVVTYTT